MPTFRNPDEVPTRLMIGHPRRPGELLPVHRRPMRNPGFDYAHPELVCFVTFCLDRSSRAIFSRQPGDVAWKAFGEVRARIGFRDHASCLMPDHFHGLWS